MFPYSLIFAYSLFNRMTRTWNSVKMLLTKVICRSFLNHLLLYHFPKKVCWKKFSHFEFGLLFFDICCLLWFCRPAPVRHFITTNKCQKNKSKLKVEELFSANFFGVSLYLKSDHKTPTNIKHSMTNHWISSTSHPNVMFAEMSRLTMGLVR